uniref:Tyrosine-protein phosphatase domain-containing protein n=1 Tax=Rhabditophanes sp. KR3021 TaxID=114890 RepID=A0AC35UHW1_9BILA
METQRNKAREDIKDLSVDQLIKLLTKEIAEEDKNMNFYVIKTKSAREYSGVRSYNATNEFTRQGGEIVKSWDHWMESSPHQTPVPTKTFAEKLEFIFIERFQRYNTNSEHSKGGMPEVYLLNHVNACGVADKLVERMFQLKMTSDD